MNRKLHLTKEACQAYKQALNYNPFLWSAFESLCQLERGVVAADVFRNNLIPSFLSHQMEQHVVTSCSTSSPVKPVVSLSSPSTEVCGYVTPDLFGNPTLGTAVASSTPALQCLATALQFGTERMKPVLSPGQFSPKALNFTPSAASQLPTDYSLTLPQPPPHNTKLVSISLYTLCISLYIFVFSLYPLCILCTCSFIIDYS